MIQVGHIESVRHGSAMISLFGCHNMLVISRENAMDHQLKAGASASRGAHEQQTARPSGSNGAILSGSR